MIKFQIKSICFQTFPPFINVFFFLFSLLIYLITYPILFIFRDTLSWNRNLNDFTSVGYLTRGPWKISAFVKTFFTYIFLHIRYRFPREKNSGEDLLRFIVCGSLKISHKRGQPTGGEPIYIYIYTHTHTHTHIYIYIYIYIYFSIFYLLSLLLFYYIYICIYSRSQKDCFLPQ